MAEYKAIHGTLFQHKTSDPLVAGTANGTWATGGALNTKRGRAGFASNANSTTHVSLVYGGNYGPGNPGKTDTTEQYNGTSWTELTTINTVRSGFGGSGTVTAAGYAGGEIPVSPSNTCLLYTSPSPRDGLLSRMPSSA